MVEPHVELRRLVNDAMVRAGQLRGTVPSIMINSSDADPTITGIEHDSRHVVSGTLYCAVRGANFDGHDFVADAAKCGATAALVEHEVPVPMVQLLTSNVRDTMPWLASTFWSNPSDRLPTIGVTGTNGKTTITTLLGQIATANGDGATVVGTLSGARTTPEAPELQRILATGLNDGHRLAALEVSSHALEQGRADAISFAVGVFTNLSVDHLDYHASMEEYFAAKAKLFDGRCRDAIIVTDDDWGKRLASIVPAALTIDLSAIAIDALNAEGSVFRWRGKKIHLPLAGDFNVVNATCAAEAASLAGYNDDQVIAGLESLDRIPGRMDRVPGLPASAPTVYVDYSHTPDGLRHALGALRPLTWGELWCVFGAGGDRDPTKRPLMGSAAEQGADTTIVTSDNPRSEDPDAIIEQVVAGMSSDANVIIEPDRRRAIDRALREASADDIVLIAGKGHEATQTTAGVTVPFDDRLVVQELMQNAPEGREEQN